MRTPRSILVTLASLVVAAALAAWAVTALRDHGIALGDARDTLALVTDLMEEHAHRTVEASDIVLLHLQERVEEEGMDSWRLSGLAYERLTEMAAMLPQVGSLWIIDAEGVVVASSLSAGPIDGDYDDRPYFRRQAERPDVGLFIGELWVGRQSGLDFFALSRRIQTPDGRFLGIVVAAIHADYFQTFYGQLNMPAGSTLAILRQDGALLVREPRPETVGGRYPETAIGLTPETPQIVRRAPSPIDGVERLAARRLVREFPLIVLATTPVDTVLAPWRERQAWTGLIIALLIGAVAALTAVGMRALRRESAARADLWLANSSLEERVAERTEELERTVTDKNLLLREVYHRVKNNLQMVEALLALQAGQIEGAAAREAFLSARQRINALGLVHQRLLRSGDLATLNLKGFLEDLCGNIAFAASAEERGIRLEVVATPLPVDLDTAIPLGLLVNELVSNAFKHAYPGREGGTITVSVHRTPSGLRLTVADDGVGAPDASSQPGDAGGDGGRSVGLRIVRALVAQLNGHLHRSADASGTRIEVDVPTGEESGDD